MRIAPALESHASAAVGETGIVRDEEVNAVLAGAFVVIQFTGPRNLGPQNGTLQIENETP